ncbi:hypothetical protein DH2020_005258 [Rehmannia glutinosa]|uniref:Leucine zipper homeobox-associated domain-containing protein n=1 Tax=Rehmannia glutinosa TaxID=99300 RepID=A0ABR0XFQ8_REHGL
MMVEKEDLGLSLSLSFPEKRAVISNLMPSSSSPSPNFSFINKNSFWTEAFPSSDRSSETCRVETRSFLKGIDVNCLPPSAAASDDAEEEGGVSSPNSTISSVSGKRSQRETTDDQDGERASSRGISDEEDAENARKKLRLSKDQTKLKQTEVDCEYLKRCCENLTEENRRLQKEVQELRALKLSPQFYMQMTPPTTLTMCPSCERVALPLAPPSSTSSATPIGSAQARPMTFNPWAATPIAHRPFNGLRSRS